LIEPDFLAGPDLASSLGPRLLNFPDISKLMGENTFRPFEKFYLTRSDLDLQSLHLRRNRVNGWRMS
jgi:hypothetical protein